jgi:deoxyribonuclease-4
MFGSHLSVSGGLHKALTAAETLGFDTVQIFTQAPAQWNLKPVVPPPTVQGPAGSQPQWAAPPLADDAVCKWKDGCGRLKFEQTVSHDSYLINLASQDPALWAKSIDAFAEELRRCVLLGIPYLVTHPGAHLGSGEDVGLARVAEALDEVHDRVPAGGKKGKPATVTCLEITAGQGSSLGYKLEHLATIIDKVKAPDRLAVCLDTAHLFAGGYDFRGRKYAGFRKQLAATVGVERVKVLHLNDSKKDLGSRVDRHEHIGKGTIGLDGFRPIVRDEAFANVPKILETAKGKDDAGREWDAVNLEVLKGLI